MKKIYTIGLLLCALMLGTGLAMAQNATKKLKKTTKSGYFNTQNAVSIYTKIDGTPNVGVQYQRKIVGNNSAYLSLGVGVAQSNTAVLQSEQNMAQKRMDLDIPHNILFNYGNKKGHFAEIGISGSFSTFSYLYHYPKYSISPVLGYRYQPISSPFFLRLFVTPPAQSLREVRGNDCLSCPINDRSAIMPSGGVGAGISF